MTEDLNYYMQKIKEGDKDSFRFLATSLGNKMFATASKLMGSNHEHEAEDAVQISLIKLWQTAPRWKNKGSVEGFVYRIIFSTCMDLHRRHKLSVELKDQDTATKTNLQNDLINLELREILLMTIKKLPDQQQLAILLHYFSGYSQKEVSTLLNKSEKATESLIIRARKKLKNLLPLNLREELSNA